MSLTVISGNIRNTGTPDELKKGDVLLSPDAGTFSLAFVKHKGGLAVVCAQKLTSTDDKNAVIRYALQNLKFKLPVFIPTVYKCGELTLMLYEAEMLAPKFNGHDIFKFGAIGIFNLIFALHERNFTCLEISDDTFVYSQNDWAFRHPDAIVPVKSPDKPLGELVPKCVNTEDLTDPDVTIFFALYACIKVIAAAVLCKSTSTITFSDCHDAWYLLRDKIDANAFKFCYRKVCTWLVLKHCHV